jgi:hypothetical protein
LVVLDDFFGSATPCASPPTLPSIFSDYSFWIHHLVNRDDRQLLANAMASDFSVPWQCLSKRTLGFFLLQIKLHALYWMTFQVRNHECDSSRFNVSCMEDLGSNELPS